MRRMRKFSEDLLRDPNKSMSDEEMCDDVESLNSSLNSSFSDSFSYSNASKFRDVYDDKEKPKRAMGAYSCRRVLFLTLAVIFIMSCLVTLMAPRPKNKTNIDIGHSKTHKEKEKVILEDEPLAADNFPREHENQQNMHMANDHGEAKKERFVVYKCNFGCGGWGDRTKAIVTGYLIALVTDRTFLIEITHPCSLDGILEPNKVQWNRELPKGLSTIEVKWDVERYGKEFIELVPDKRHMNELFPEDVIVVRGQIAGVDRFKDNPVYAEKIKSLGYDLSTFTQSHIYGVFYDLIFKLSPVMERRFQEFAQISKKHEGYHLFCAQMRMGAPYIRYDPVINKRETASAVWDFMKENAHGKYKIFISTDAEDVRKEAKSIFPESIIDNEGQITHLDADNADDSCKGLQKTLLDFHALAYCDTLVVSSSSFGFGAAYRKDEYANIYLFYNGTVLKFV
ncbi:unnamed protein product [Owenia fusiformis]|uniref:Uncharacterized protein n=1 Tax=Owenia fusiformis TaxID=6347 RepID=A0A8J1T5G1_OWEFU|nr:unnamed protein product [Owenia fusiformis]